MPLASPFFLSPPPFLSKCKWLGSPPGLSSSALLTFSWTFPTQVQPSCLPSHGCIRASELCWRKITIVKTLPAVQLSVSPLSVSCSCVSQIRAFEFKCVLVSFNCSFLFLIVYYFEYINIFKVMPFLPMLQIIYVNFLHIHKMDSYH